MITKKGAPLEYLPRGPRVSSYATGPRPMPRTLLSRPRPKRRPLFFVLEAPRGQLGYVLKDTSIGVECGGEREDEGYAYPPPTHKLFGVGGTVSPLFRHVWHNFGWKIVKVEVTTGNNIAQVVQDATNIDFRFRMWLQMHHSAHKKNPQIF